MKPITTLIVAALAQSANVFVAAECKWRQCWEITHHGAATGWRGSEVCEDKCRSERWRSRSIFHLDAWGCRMDDIYETDRQAIHDFYTCCEAQGSGYKYSTQPC